MARELDVVTETESADVGHDVISAVGRESSKTCLLKFGQDQIAARFVIGLQPIVVGGRQRKRVSTRGLQRRGRAHRQKVVYFANRAGDLSRSDAVTDAPAGDRIG